MKMSIKHAFILSATISIVVFTGWGLNIYKLATECDFVAPYKCEVIRAIGVVPPMAQLLVGLIWGNKNA